MIEKLAV